jgi:benzylsuccinate CoA-transferase BbsE subunit
VTNSAKALDGVIVVDLSDAMGNYCGKLFADLGADVVLVEPPGGTELRREPPFVAGVDGTSLRFLYHNSSKRSVVVDFDNPDDVALLVELIASAHLVIDSGAPGRLARLGIGYHELAARNPGLVVASITPFGMTGPYSHYQASDIVCLAMGGLMSLAGYQDGPPVQVCENQSFVMGSLFAAVGSMIALLYADASGEGQFIDVSLQECVSLALENAPQYFDLEGIVRGRPGGMQRHAGSGVFSCADGYVYLFVGGVASNRFWGLLAQWLIEEDCKQAEVLLEPEWQELDFLRTEQAKVTFASIFHELASRLGRAELYQLAQARGIPLCPVNSPADLVDSRQLQHRQFFSYIRDTSGADFLMPGAPYKLSLTPWQIERPIAALGEHTAQVWADVRSTA